MKHFDYWNTLHINQKLEEFSSDRVGLLWLKTKSIIRKELVAGFLEFSSLTLTTVKQGENFRELFGTLSQDVEKAHSLLDSFIRKVYGERIQNFKPEKLVSELYKLKYFEWGGDHQNSLDKYLVSRHIKTQDPSYEKLMAKFETEINPAVQGYVLNSWYNHWSSILIEHIFSSHQTVLPAVGQIKNVDFFIGDIPFDLKVTYLPSGYIAQKRKEKNYPVEFTYLKKKAREAKISFDRKAEASTIFYEIVQKLKDKNDSPSNSVLQELKDQKLSILAEAQSNPKILARWLYENQGEMRFGSENRLFLVLVDTEDFDSSWKLKRNLDLLKPTIQAYLDSFSTKQIADLKVDFNFKGQPYSALADVIFVVK